MKLTADRKMSSNSELANKEVWNLWLHQKPLAHCSHHIAMDVEGLKGVELTIKAAGDEYQSPNPDRLAQLGSLAVKSTHPGSMSCLAGSFLSSSSSAQNRGHICSRRALVPLLLISNRDSPLESDISGHLGMFQTKQRPRSFSQEHPSSSKSKMGGQRNS